MGSPWYVLSSGPGLRREIGSAQAPIKDPGPLAIAPIRAYVAGAGERVHWDVEHVGVGFELVFGAVAVVLAADGNGLPARALDRCGIQWRREKAGDSRRSVSRRKVSRYVRRRHQQNSLGDLGVCGACVVEPRNSPQAVANYSRSGAGKLLHGFVEAGDPGCQARGAGVRHLGVTDVTAFLLELRDEPLVPVRRLIASPPMQDQKRIGFRQLSNSYSISFAC